MNNIDSPQNKACHSTDKDTDAIITLPSVVTACLTSSHTECNGEYTDTHHFFRLRCVCLCHHDHNNEGGYN